MCKLVSVIKPKRGSVWTKGKKILRREKEER